jgi:hypothetical protein
MIFIRAANPIWYFVDLEGLGLNDQFYAFFLTNTLPYLPQAVYMDPNGISAWSDPIQFYPNGTLPDNLYFDPTLVYRMEVRKGPTQNDPLIYEINNFVPGDSSINSINTFDNSENQISNPQFALIDFVSPFTFTKAIFGTYTVNVAPGWKLVLTGIGTTILSQIELSGVDSSGSPIIPGNPPFALEIDNTGWTTAQLIQTFEDNGAIFANGAISMSILARAYVNPELITLTYSPSSPGTPVVVASGTIPVGVFTTLSGAVNLPPSTNTNIGNSASVEMIINLLGTGKIDITNVQFLGQSVPLATDFDPANDIPPFQEQTIENQINNLFHVYKQSLITEPKTSVLAGWNFPLNPYQFNSRTITLVAAQTSYIADQTILYQQANPLNLKTGVSTVDTSGGLEIIPDVGAGLGATQFALIQYIDPATAAPLWGNYLSSLAKMRIFTPNGTQVPVKMRLIYRTTLPPTISATEPIASWALGSDPVFAAGWTAIAPQNDPNYILPNSYDDLGTESYPSFAYDKFDLPASTSATMTLGIVIYTMNSLVPTAGIQDAIVFKSISLVPNEFAIETQAETFNEALRKCQFYYEKSYDNTVLPTTAASTPGLVFAEQWGAENGGGDTVFVIRGFGVRYNEIKRSSAPVITLYAVTNGASDGVDAFLFNNGIQATSAVIPFSTNWTLNGDGEKGFWATPKNAAELLTAAGPGTYPEGFINFHYTADARLGV